MPRVSPRRTPKDVGQVEVELRQAWQERFSEPIEPAVLALLLALADLEVGDGVPGATTLPNSFHHNIGNITVSSEFINTTPSEWFTLSGDEGPGTGSDAAEHFYKAWPTSQAGADGLVTFLTRPERQEWWDGLMTGDPESFVMALAGRNGGPAYYERDPERYLRTFNKRWAKYGPRLLSPDDRPPTTIPDSDLPEPDTDSDPDPFSLPRLSDAEESQVKGAALAFAVVGLGGLLLLKQLQKRSRAGG